MSSLISAQGLTKNGAILSNDLTPSTLKVGTVTYPNTNGIDGQVLTTNGEGTAIWTTPTSAANASSFPMVSTSERDLLGITTPGYVVFNSTTNTYQGTQAILSPYNNLTTTIYGEARCKGSYYLSQTFKADGQTISSATLSVYQVITPGTFHFALIDTNMGFTVSEADFAVSSGNIGSTVNIPLTGGEGNVELWGSNYTIKITCLDGGDVKFLLNANSGVGTYYSSLDSFTSTGHNISCKLNLVTEGVKWVNTNSDLTSTAVSNTYLSLNGGQLTGDLSGTNVILSGNVTATEYKIPSGTSSQFLKADGTVDASTYMTSATGLPLSGGTLTGELTGTSFVKSGGTSSEFLKADGTVDSNTYLTTSSAADNYSTKITQTHDLAVTQINNSYSGSIFYTDSNYNFFESNLSDGFTCTILNTGNGAISLSNGNNIFYSVINSSGTNTYNIQPGATIKLNVITVGGEKRYYLSGDIMIAN